MIEQSPYGNISKMWNYDRTISCNLEVAGAKTKEELIPNILISDSSVLLGRVRSDIRISSDKEMFGTTNIVLTNIRDRSCNEIFIETDGPRQGKSTLFEIMTFQPILGAFGRVDYYKILIKRSENQEFDV
jgi:hypothetical protein